MSKVISFPSPKQQTTVLNPEQSAHGQSIAGHVQLPSNWGAYNAQKYVKDVCSKQIRERLRIFESGWPNLYGATMRLGMQITSQYPAKNGELLLGTTIANAFERYDEMGAARTLNIRAQLAYLDALASCAPQVLDYLVLGEKKNEEICHWSPFKQPLAQWIRHQEIVALRFEPTDEYNSIKQDSKKLLAHAILDTEDMLMLSQQATW